MATHKEALRLAVEVLGNPTIKDDADAMEAAIRAYLDAMDAVIVPREPTEAMIMTQGKSRPDLAESETTRKIAHHLNVSVRKAAVVTFKEMLSAAPNPFKDGAAEARVKELEATIKAREAGLRTQVANHTEALRHVTEWQARASALQALLGEVGEVIDQNWLGEYWRSVDAAMASRVSAIAAKIKEAKG